MHESYHSRTVKVVKLTLRLPRSRQRRETYQ